MGLKLLDQLRNMLLLITAAGKGSRFKRQELIYKTANQYQQDAFEHTLESFDFSVIDRLVITTQTSDNIKSKIIDKLCNLYNGTQITWLEIDGLLPGQLYASYHALTKLIEEDKEIEKLPMWIHNCDTGFTWNKRLSRIRFSSMPVFMQMGRTGHSASLILTISIKQLELPRKTEF